jgi:Holliday junction resolvase
MTSSSKRKGSSAEVAIVKWLSSRGIRAGRIRAGWTDDRGDINALDGVVIEVKNRKSHDWKAYFEQLGRQMEASDAWSGVILCKRPGYTNPDDWLAVMPAAVWLTTIQLITETQEESKEWPSS